MYNRYLETDAEAYWKHQQTLKKNAADRLKAVAAKKAKKRKVAE